MTIKFLHIRKCEMLDEDDQALIDNGLDDLVEYTMSQFGGLTIAYSANVLGISFSIARCHPKDHFSRKIGRELAEHRLRMEGPYDILQFQHPIAATIREWLSSYFGYELMEGPNGQWMSPLEEPFETLSDHLFDNNFELETTKNNEIPNFTTLANMDEDEFRTYQSKRVG